MKELAIDYIITFEEFQTYVKDVLSEQLIGIYDKYKNNPEHAQSFDEISKMYYALLEKYEKKINSKIDELYISKEESKQAKAYAKDVLRNMIIYVEQSATVDIVLNEKKPFLMPFKRSAAKALTMTKELNENGDYIVKYAPKGTDTVYISDAYGNEIGVTGKDLSAAAAKDLYKKGYNIKYFDDPKVLSRVKMDCQIKANPYSSEILSLIDHMNEYQNNIKNEQ